MNNRWRSYRKLRHLSKQEVWDYEGYLGNMYERFNKCPCCGRQLVSRSWSEEYIGEVERIKECKPCGYTDHYSYGSTELSVGNYVNGFSYSTPHKFIQRIQDEFVSEIRKARRLRKLNIRKFLARKA